MAVVMLAASEWGLGGTGMAQEGAVVGELVGAYPAERGRIGVEGGGGLLPACLTRWMAFGRW